MEYYCYLCSVNEIEDAGPLFFVISDMNRNTITEKITPAVESRGCFITEVTVSTANDITVYIEKTDGIVDWDDCAAIDEAFHAIFNPD